jgi:uncharacterized protein
VRAGSTVLVDTGPLVALFDPSDRHHEPCKTELAKLGACRLVTTLAVLTEATYLLAFSSLAQRAVLDFVGAGAVEVPEFGPSDVARASALMKKYEDLPMDLADATLVVLADKLRTQWVFTLDRRDFLTYRVGRRSLRLLPEPR